MTSRNALAACFWIALAYSPVHLTSDQNAVIAAALAHNFPDRSKPLFVSKVLVEPHWKPRAARGENQWIDALEIGRPVKIGTTGTLVISVPEIVGDDALFEFIVQGERVDVSLSRERSKWIVTKEERVAPPGALSPPPPQARDFDAPLHVGGAVKAPVIVKRVEPVSTPLAKRAHISGIVILELIVDKEGHLTNVRILKPLPMGLDAAAEQAVRQWEFRPGTLNGVPVAVIFNVTVRFDNE
jgi:TonB family protein